jgi:hypothetical protein
MKIIHNHGADFYQWKKGEGIKRRGAGSKISFIFPASRFTLIAHIDSIPHGLHKTPQGAAADNGFTMREVSQHPGSQAFADLQLHAHGPPAAIADVMLVTAFYASEIHLFFTEKGLESSLLKSFHNATAQGGIDPAHEYNFFVFRAAVYRYHGLRIADDFKGPGFIEKGACNMEVLVFGLPQAFERIE